MMVFASQLGVVRPRDRATGALGKKFAHMKSSTLAIMSGVISRNLTPSQFAGPLQQSQVTVLQ